MPTARRGRDAEVYTVMKRENEIHLSQRSCENKSFGMDSQVDVDS